MSVLRQLVLSKTIERHRAEIAELDKQQEGFNERRAALNTRGEELAAALEEVTPETPEEERQAVEDEVTQHENDVQALTDEENDVAAKRAGLEEKISQLQAELDELAERAKNKPAAPEQTKPTERKDEYTMNTRTIFGSMQERDALFARDDMKNFAKRLRELAAQKRDVNGGELLIPDVLLGVLREQTATASKLLKHVNHRRIGGTSRVIVAGTIPEAVWTEMCAAINELHLGFYGDEMDGYKEAGYIAVCRALMEDSDINLVTEIVTALSKALALALDKAILYGKGVKMPMGIVTRLAQAAKPENYNAKARPWQNLSTTNLKTVTGKTGIELFQALALALSAANNDFATGGTFWAMNEKTKTKLMVEAMSISAAGAIVTGMQNTMPVIGGAIETLGFIPEGVIIGGYGEHYFLAERAGAAIERSDHVRFLEDEVVFKGTARYDGKPIIAESFVGIGIDVDAPAADDVTFPEDLANAG